MFFFNKDWHSVKNACVTPKKFTPDQIFYTFPVYGLNVQMFGVKVPPMKRINFIKLNPTSNTRIILPENLPQTSRFFTRIYPQYPWHYTTLKSGNLSNLDGDEDLVQYLGEGFWPAVLSNHSIQPIASSPATPLTSLPLCISDCCLPRRGGG